MPRSPDFLLRALNKKTDRQSTIGAAWSHADGHIEIKLNDFIEIKQDGQSELFLVPNERDQRNN